jgi:hypothetical protein
LLEYASIRHGSDNPIAGVRATYARVKAEWRALREADTAKREARDK